MNIKRQPPATGKGAALLVATGMLELSLGSHADNQPGDKDPCQTSAVTALPPLCYSSRASAVVGSVTSRRRAADIN